MRARSRTGIYSGCGCRDGQRMPCNTPDGVAVDGSHCSVTDKMADRNNRTSKASIVSPKGTATIGPWNGTEFFVNGSTGFHSNSVLGTPLKYDSTGEAVDPVTPLVRQRARRLASVLSPCGTFREHGDALEAAPRFRVGV